MYYKPLLFAAFFLITFTVRAQEIIPLYPDSVPNSIVSAVPERLQSEGREAFQVKDPTLSIFLPPKEKANGTAVIICPGGGYRMLVIGREGYDVAKDFNKLGVAAFVLKYRLPSDETMQDKSIGPLQDAQQAIKTIRENASSYNIDPNKIGIMGFSAGGHLASTAGTHFHESYVDNPDSTSVRPDFMLLVYPVISMTRKLGHSGSARNLLGVKPAQLQVAKFSNETQVTPDTPPVFLLHAGDDDVVKIQNSLEFYQALQVDSVAAGMHIYPTGKHGFSEEPAKSNWFDQCILWMKSSGLL